MARCDFDHLADCNNVSSLLSQRLSDLKVVYSIGKLCYNTKDMFFDEIA